MNENSPSALRTGRVHIRLNSHHLRYPRLCDGALDYSNSVDLMHFRDNPAEHITRLRREFGICLTCEARAYQVLEKDHHEGYLDSQLRFMPFWQRLNKIKFRRAIAEKLPDSYFKDA